MYNNVQRNEHLNSRCSKDHVASDSTSSAKVTYPISQRYHKRVFAIICRAAANNSWVGDKLVHLWRGILNINIILRELFLYFAV